MNDSLSTEKKQSRVLLGCIADDVTGATDLSINLVQGGMRVVQWLQVPSAQQMREIEADAVVVALKSRSISPEQAVEKSLEALKALQQMGCTRFYFKYCSTFDSTDQGNIGPVAEALLESLSAEQTIFCPAFPEAGRTVYLGHLFVNGDLLHESGMQNHPLNPMKDSCLTRVLSRQSTQDVGLVPSLDVVAGADSITKQLQLLCERGTRFVVIDTLDENHLRNIAEASIHFPLVTGGSGLARFLPEAYRANNLLQQNSVKPVFPAIGGRSAIFSGSCSQATLAQVAKQRERSAAYFIDIAQLMQSAEESYQAILNWVQQQAEGQTIMIYSSDTHENVALVQEKYGQEQVATRIEQLMARVAETLVKDYDVRKMIVAGGETASAIAAAMKVQALRIGPAICPGVPWTESISEPRLALAFKSGNFGDEDFFQTALEMLA